MLVFFIGFKNDDYLNRLVVLFEINYDFTGNIKTNPFQLKPFQNARVRKTQCTIWILPMRTYINLFATSPNKIL
jgi:hypothetical protein